MRLFLIADLKPGSNVNVLCNAKLKYYLKCTIKYIRFLVLIGSVSNELRDLEAKRQKLQSEVVTFTHKIEVLKTELNRQQTELNKLKLSVQQVLFILKTAFLENLLHSFISLYLKY